MAKWEYNVVDFRLSQDANFVAENLNKAGAEGWDVVAATVLHDSGTYRVIRKRPKAAPPKKVRVY